MAVPVRSSAPNASNTHHCYTDAGRKHHYLPHAYNHKCTKLQFICLLTVTCNE